MSNRTDATEAETAVSAMEKENTQIAGAGNWSLKWNPDSLSSFSVVVGACAILYLAVPEDFVVTSHAVANVAALWVASVGAGYLFEAVGIPPLLGSLIAGIVLQNAVDSFQLSSRFGEVIQTVGLCIILLISSTEIDANAVAKAGGVSLRLTCLPGLVEAMGTAAVSHWMFEMPFALALSLGFILAAVSPAIVIPGMLDLQQRGYGVGKGIPSLVMAACALDDIVAITGFTICMGIAMDGNDNFALAAFLHGPIAIFLGMVTGGVGGMALAAARFCPHPWQRTAIAIELGLLMTWMYKRAGFDASGAVGTLLMGTVAKLIWERQRIIELTQCSGADFLHRIGLDVNIVWDVAVLPLLFGSIGAAFDLNIMPADSIFKSCAIVSTGIFVRLPTAFACTFGKNLTTRERLFVATSWTPKATVQAALCSLPLSTIKKTYRGDSYNYNQLVDWGTQIMTTAILAIIITAPVGLLSIQFLGPYLLSRESQRSKVITQ